MTTCDKENIMTRWNNDTEIQFFTEALKNFASPEQIFYHLSCIVPIVFVVASC